MKNNQILSIAKKEIMDNIRNFRVILVTLIFAVLTLVVSYFGSIYSEGWQDFGTTIALMISFIQWLVPIIGLMLGYATIIGEIERGSMNSLMSLPVKRIEIILGKFIGLASVLSITILVGFGIAGVVIALNVSHVQYDDCLQFIAATILIGLVFLSLAMFFSNLFERRSTAMGGAIFLWFFFNIIFPIILLGIATAGIGIEKIVAGEIPEWYYSLQLINPISVYSTLVVLNVEAVTSTQSGIEISYPQYYTSELMIIILLIWVTLFLFLSFWRFKIKDI